MCVICKPSAKIACDYKPYGYQEMVKYTKRYAHVKSCTFSPCLCPQTDCNFRANSKALGEHFRTNHQAHVPPFTYDGVFFASIHIKDNVTILREINDGELFCYYLWDSLYFERTQSLPYWTH